MKQEKIYNVNIIKFNGVEELSEVVENLGASHGGSFRDFLVLLTRTRHFEFRELSWTGNLKRLGFKEVFRPN